MWQVKFNEVEKEKGLEPGAYCACSELIWDTYYRRHRYFCRANRINECVGLGNEGCIAEKIPPQKEE